MARFLSRDVLFPRENWYFNRPDIIFLGSMDNNDYYLREGQIISIVDFAGIYYLYGLNDLGSLGLKAAQEKAKKLLMLK